MARIMYVIVIVSNASYSRNSYYIQPILIDQKQVSSVFSAVPANGDCQEKRQV